MLYAACQEEALVSYQPFVEALRHYARAPAAGRAGSLGPARPSSPALIPELARRPTPIADAEMRRYLLFEAVSRSARRGGRAPLVLVLDDLHWADRATLHLLRHVVRAPARGALLIVGTYRDAEVAVAPARRRCSPTCAATGWSSASRSTAWTSARSAR